MKAIQETVRTASDLVQHLSPERPYDIHALVVKTGPGEGNSPFAAWREHLASILADGAKNHPEQFLPQLANLLATTNSSARAPERDPPIFKYSYEIDRARAGALLGKFLEKALVELANYRGNNDYARRAKQEAAKWLQELRDATRR